MAIEITVNGTLNHDQSSGVQKDDIVINSDLNALPDAFESFLENSLGESIPATLLNNAANYAAARENASFIQINETNGVPIDDVFFSDSQGNLFDGDLARYNGLPLHVTGSTDNIYLYSFDKGNILIASTQDPNTVNITNPSTLDASKLVFAYYLEETGTHTSANVWGVTFQPLQHSDLNNPDDAIDLGDFLNISAKKTMTFEFDDLRSGKALWAAIGTENSAVLLTGRDLNVTNTGLVVTSGSDPSDLVSSSQGGSGATVGINNQMFTPGDTGVFTFVKGFVPLAGSTTGDAVGNNINQIDYNEYINTDGASLFISQTQGKGKVNLTIKAFEASFVNSTPEEGLNYIGEEGGNNGTSGAFENDLRIPVATVSIYSNNGNTLVGTWGIGGVNSGTNIAGVTVTISSNSITVSGITTGYVVHWDVTDNETFNRFQVTANTGSQKFDVGMVSADEGIINTKNIGEQVLIHDDGPIIVSNNAVVQLDDDALPGGLPNGNGDDPNSANATGILNYSFGTDGAGGIQFTGGTLPAGFTFNSVNSTTSQISQGGAVVLTLTLNSGTGAYQVVQNSPIDHPTTSIEDNLIFDINYRVTDADGDTANGTLQINVDDDSPLVTGTLNPSTRLQVDEMDLATPSSSDSFSSPGSIGTFTAAFGADGASNVNAVVYSLSLAGSNVLSGLSTVDGSSIVLNQSGNTITGSVGAVTYFTIQINATTGVVTFNLFKNVFHPNDPGPSPFNDEVVMIATSSAADIKVTQTITDGDGDSHSASLNVGRGVFFISDDGPTVNGNAVVQLDDDAFPGGLPNGNGDDPNSVNTTGILNYSFGTDGAGGIQFTGGTLPAGFTFNSVNSTTSQISQGGAVVLTLTLNSGTGAYQVVQNSPIDHPTTSIEDNLIFDINYRVTDADGDTANGTLRINVDDDSPLSTGTLNPSTRLQVDEMDLATPGSSDSASSLSSFGSFTAAFGADGASNVNAVVYSLSLAGSNVLSGLSTVDGSSIVLNQSGNTITGSVGAVTYFTIQINATNGVVTFNLFKNVFHPNDPGPSPFNDEVVMIATSSAADIKVIQTITDGDGDSHSASLNVGRGVFFISDDGPTVGVNTIAVVDEDGLQGGNPGGNGDVSGNNTVASGTLNHNFGTDGAGKITFMGDGVVSNGYLYSVDPGTGTLTISQNGISVMSITLNATTGAYVATLHDNISHPDTSKEDNFRFDLNYRVTDGDGDIADGKLQIDVNDDTAVFTSNILNSSVNFELNESVINSLNGAIGADDLFSKYTFNSAVINQTSIDGLKVAIIANGTQAVFYTDGAGGTADIYNAGTDTLYFDNILSQTANSGAGSYTFTVYQDAPSDTQNPDQIFDFQVTATDADSDTVSSNQFQVGVVDDISEALKTDFIVI